MPPDMQTFDGMGLTTPQADLDFLRGLVAGLLARHTFPLPLRVVEVGSWAGRTALNFLDAEVEPHDVHVYCVDTWRGTPNDTTGNLVRQYGGPGGIFRAFLRNVGARAWRTVFPCVGPSSFWAQALPFEADLVFLDADHDYHAAWGDIRDWMPKVKKGGILCGHDYGAAFPGVAAAVDQLVPGREVGGHCVWWKRM